MAVSLSVIAAKDSAGTAIAGGLQAQDKSGAGTGPFTLGQVLIDGVAGTNMAQVTAANAVKVDGSAVTQPVSLGTTQNTNLANIDSQTSRLTSSATNITAGSALATTSFVIGSRYLSTPPTFTNGQEGALQISSAGRLLTDANVVNANANGRAAAASSAPVVLSTEDNALVARLLPTATASGATASRVNAAATTNATSLKASAGQLYTLDFFNVAAYNVFFKLYNKASAPTVGTDTPVMTIPIQAGGGYSKTWPTGLTFSTGIAYAITKLQADSDTTAVVAGDLTGNTTWI